MCRFGAGVFETLGKVLRGRAYCLVTYDDANGGGVFADLARRVEAMAGAPAAAVATSGPIPTASIWWSPAASSAPRRGPK